MGVDVVVGGANQPALADIVDLFHEREQIFTRFAPGSELSRVNASMEADVLVSDLFAHAVAAALAAWRATDGLVDPTLAEAVDAAGYDRDFASLPPNDPRPPGPPAPGRAGEVALHGRLLARPPGLRLDLAGVVKAMTVDAALRLLPGSGFVSAGGDIATRGPTPIGLPGGGSVSLLDGGLATSGPAGRHWRRAGRHAHHLIDPRTGAPSRSRWSQVTVSAGSCLGADVAAKAAYLLSDDGPDWLDARALPGRFLAEDDLVENETWQALVGEPACL